MKKTALITSLLGISLLFFIYFHQHPIIINDYSKLNSQEENSLIKTSGIVKKEYFNQNSRTLILDNNITLICECKGILDLKNLNISALGYLDKFNYPKLKIKEIEIS